MSVSEKKFELYSIVLRFLLFKITQNLKRIYLDFDYDNHRMFLTAYYKKQPSTLDLDLFDDIVTNSNAHIPDFYIEKDYKLTKDFDKNNKHEFLVFAVYQNI